MCLMFPIPKSNVSNDGSNSVPEPHSNSSSAASTPHTFDTNSIVKQLVKTSTAAIARISFNLWYRMTHYKENKMLLTQGIFYGNQYFEALNNLGKPTDIARKQSMIQAGFFYHGKTVTDFFEPIRAAHCPGGILATQFKLKSGVKPSAAIKALHSGLSFLGCGEACQISYLEAILELIGSKKFDVLFASESLQPLIIGFPSRIASDMFSCFIQQLSPSASIEEGDIIYISNVTNYCTKHINGESAGYFCIYTRDGFKGLGLNPEGMTQQQIATQLRKEYNDRPIGGAAITPQLNEEILKAYSAQDLQRSFALNNHTLTEDQFSKAQGGKIVAIFRFNFKRINQLFESSMSDLENLIFSWAENKDKEQLKGFEANTKP